MSRLTEDLVEFVKRWEGLKLTASPDPLVLGVVDIGHGHRIYTKEPMTITREEADRLVREDLEAHAAGVDEVVTVTLATHERDALTSLSYNIGAKALEGSTLVRLLNEGDFDGAAAQFAVWKWAGKGANRKIAPGLVKRRAAERAIFDSAQYAGAP